MVPMINSSKQMITNFKTLRESMPILDNVAMNMLQKICRADVNFFKQYGDVEITPSGPLIFQDNGADVLAIGHLDTVQKAHHFSITSLSHDKRIHCPTLDDRLGVFTLLHVLPKMNIVTDILLTTGEEKMQSSAQYFVPPPGKKYKWMFSFDRAETDCVLYDYFDWEMKTLLDRAGWKTGYGLYSDICELEHLRCKGFNFGVGYHDAHSLDAWASVNELLLNLKKFERFFKKNCDLSLKHTPRYNMWTVEDGFAFVYKPGSVPYQDTFTDAEIELIMQIDYEGLELGKSRVTPYDLRMTYNEAIGKAPTDWPEPIEEPTLFEDLTRIERVKDSKEKETSKEQTSGPKKMKVRANVSLPSGETRSTVPSEEDPMGSLAQTRKSVESSTIIHSEGNDLEKAEMLARDEESKGKVTLGPLIRSNLKCDICGGEDGNPCNKCLVEAADRRVEQIREAKERLKKEKEVSLSKAGSLRVVANIPLAGKAKETDEELRYIPSVTGEWIWGKVRKPLKINELVF